MVIWTRPLDGRERKQIFKKKKQNIYRLVAKVGISQVRLMLLCCLFWCYLEAVQTAG